MTDVVGASPFRNVCRISLAGFEHILESANPAVLRERSAGEYYATILGYHLDPLFLVAKFNHESSLGKAGVAVTTHSWGNTRAPNFGATPIGMTPGRTGTFPIWKDWLDGLKSTCARLTTHEWVYFGRDEIEEIYDHPSGDVWAPAGDLNDPHGYLRAVLDFMNEHQDVEEEQPVGTVPKPKMVQKPSPNKDGYGTARNIEAICNHIATGTKSSNLDWLTNPASKVSCNAYIAKDGTIYELVPKSSSAWTNGAVDAPDLSNPLIAAWVRAGVNPNTHTYTIEHEGEPGDSLTEAQIRSNNRVTAWVSSEDGVPIDRTHIIGHYQIDSVNRPYCPSFSDAEWQRLITGALQQMQSVPVPPAVPGGTTVETINGMKVLGGILAFYNANGRERIVGVPLNEEHNFTAEDGKKVRRQDFDKLGLEWAEGMAPDSFDVRVANSNAESLRLRTLLNEDDAYAAIQQIKLLVKDIA